MKHFFATFLAGWLCGYAFLIYLGGEQVSQLGARMIAAGTHYRISMEANVPEVRAATYDNSLSSRTGGQRR